MFKFSQNNTDAVGFVQPSFAIGADTEWEPVVTSAIFAAILDLDSPELRH